MDILDGIATMRHAFMYANLKPPATLRTRFDAARRAAAEQAGGDALAERIRRFQFRDIRPKAASELPVEHASRLLGHSEKEITERVYRRLGEVVKPTK